MCTERTLARLLKMKQSRVQLIWLALFWGVEKQTNNTTNKNVVGQLISVTEKITWMLPCTEVYQQENNEHSQHTYNVVAMSAVYILHDHIISIQFFIQIAKYILAHLQNIQYKYTNTLT